MPGRRHLPHVLRSIDRLPLVQRLLPEAARHARGGDLRVAFHDRGARALLLARPGRSFPTASTPTSSIRASPRRRPSAKDVPSILFLGRFDPRNGLTTLIDSFRKVKGARRQAQLVVVGDGPLREHYYKQANGDDGHHVRRRRARGSAELLRAQLDLRLPHHQGVVRHHAARVDGLRDADRLLRHPRLPGRRRERPRSAHDVRAAIATRSPTRSCSCSTTRACASSSAPTGRHESHEVQLAARDVAGARRLSRRHGARRRSPYDRRGRRPASPRPALAAHGTWHRNSPVFGPVITRLPGTAGRRQHHVRRRPESRRDAAHPRRAAARAACTRPSSCSAGTPSGGRRSSSRMADEGHQLGNHGYFHRKLHRRTPPTSATISRAAPSRSCARAACGRAVFRAPHGFRNPWVTPIAASLGQRTVGWSLGVWDSARPGADVIARRALDGAAARARSCCCTTATATIPTATACRRPRPCPSSSTACASADFASRRCQTEPAARRMKPASRASSDSASPSHPGHARPVRPQGELARHLAQRCETRRSPHPARGRAREPGVASS